MISWNRLFMHFFFFCKNGEQLKAVKIFARVLNMFLILVPKQLVSDKYSSFMMIFLYLLSELRSMYLNVDWQACLYCLWQVRLWISKKKKIDRTSFRNSCIAYEKNTSEVACGRIWYLLRDYSFSTYAKFPKN